MPAVAREPGPEAAGSVAVQPAAAQGNPFTAAVTSPKRHLRIVVVDTRKGPAGREAQHRLLLASLTAAASDGAGAAAVIDARPADVAEAKARFLSGGCDAVLLLANERPTGLRRLDATTHCGVLEPDWGVHPIYLIVAREPDAAQVMLARAFNRMLGDRAALRAIVSAGNSGPVAASAALAQ